MQVISVAQRAKDLEAFSHDRFSEEYERRLEQLLTDLFQTGPDCEDEVWEGVAEEFDTKIGRSRAVPFCLERGYDIRSEPGNDRSPLVACWRDVGIMLLARDRGLLRAAV
ncbi:hypothetical protein [Arenibaculum pallidiluteum]|uniref:hypothetical protein n=1 Tax=Arenibaculum pallidiluteum TaxID=2812559 RepID=UPI001A96217C|nr:hypothetical protein [Arenibaculum pallidiluteum]